MIEILTIGNEILSGKIVNTNLSFIAKALNRYGYQLSYQSTVSDHKSAIQEGLKLALSRADVIITTGGLGPTLDDLTKEACSEFFHKPCYLHPKIYQDLRSRYGDKLSSLENQATVPRDTELMENKVGTAPGFIFSHFNQRIYILPGVPSEMELMLCEQVLPDLLKHFPKEPDFLKKSYYFCHLSENALDPLLRKIQSQYPKLNIGIYPGYGLLGVEVFSDKNMPGLEELLDSCFEKEFGSYLFSTGHSSLAQAVQAKMVDLQKTLFLAESCTGGKVAATLVSQAGSSKYFQGSCVVYSDELKNKILGVSKESIKSHGAVSFEVVKQMLVGSLQLTQADYILAVSGIAGPDGGTEDKPVGTVVCGLLDKKGPMFVWKIAAKGKGKRENVIEYTTQYILGALWRYVAYQINPS